MSEKAKRKGNPRRRLQGQFLLLLGFLIAVGIGLWHIIRPEQQEIVTFIDNGEDGYAVWLVDSEGRSNGRVLADGLGLYPNSAQVIGERLFYTLTDTFELGVIDLQSGTQQIHDYCQHWHFCDLDTLSPDGQWIAFIGYWSEQDALLKEVGIYNLQSGEYQATPIIIETHRPPAALAWMNDNRTLIYPIFTTNDGLSTLALYDILEQRTINQDYIDLPNRYYYDYFSPSGQYYVPRPEKDENNLMAAGFELRSIATDEIIFIDNTTHPQPDALRRYYYLLDWEQNDQAVLIDERWNEVPYYILKYINVETGQVQTMFQSRESVILSASFNADATHILMTTSVIGTRETIISTIDIATGEETVLSIAGENPIWRE